MNQYLFLTFLRTKRLIIFILAIGHSSLTYPNDYFPNERENESNRPGVPATYLNSQVEKHWRSLGKSKGFNLYSSHVEGTQLLAFRGIGVLKVNLLSVLQVLRDIDDQINWIPYLVEKKVIKEYDFTHLVTYNLNDVPWPATNRDAFLESKLETKERPPMVIISTWSVPGTGEKKDPPPGVIRAIISSSHLKLVPHSEGLIVDVDAHMDPKGWVPTFITNIIQRSWAPNFLINLETKASERQKHLNQEEIHPKFLKLDEWMKKKREEALFN